MKTARFIFILLSLLVGCRGIHLDDAAVDKMQYEDIDSSQTDSLYKYIQRFPDNTQLAISLIKNGQVTYFGSIRMDDTLTAIQNSSAIFEIGSITKVLTTTVLSHFVLAGELDLHDNINVQFDYDFNDGLEFTYQELANHTSGLPRIPGNMRLGAILSPSDPYKNYDTDKLDDYLQNDIKLEYNKGQESRYSNLGMGLLSYALRRYANKSFESLTKELVFDRYDMSNSTTNKELIANTLVQGQNDKGKPTSNWTPGALVGAGGVYSSVEDLSKFVIAQFDSSNKELALTRSLTFQKTKNKGVGLGWFILTQSNGDQWFWHNGGTGGYTSSMVADVDNKLGVVILSNLSSYHKQVSHVDKLAFALMKSLR